MQEEWRSVSGYEGLYEVSNLGRVTTQGNDAHAQRMGLKAYGERHPAAKLTWRAVAVIREQRETRTMSNKAIAAKYGVSESTIERVLSRARWNFPSDLPSRP